MLLCYLQGPEIQAVMTVTLGTYLKTQKMNLIQKLSSGIPNVVTYLDDIILTGATDDEHRRTLKLVLGRLKEVGLRIRKEKFTFFQKEVEYLGHSLSSKGIRADPKKTAAIVNMPLPTNIAKLRFFLGMCNFYTEFVPKLAEMCSPLNQLLRKEARWNWTGEHTKAVERVKRLLNSPLLLTHYHPEWPIVLAADASNEGIGAVVYHRLRDGTVKVIAPASKMLNAAQRNYGQIEKEALALVYGVKKFHKYLWGRRFTLLTDHKPLVSIFGSKKGVPQMAACRLTRWAIALMNYSFDIEYRSTKNFCQADCLSRLPSSSDELFDANFDHREAEDELTVKQLIVELQAELPVTARVIAEATEKDSVLKQVKQFVLSGWPEKCPREELRSYFIKRTELSVSYGCLLWGIKTTAMNKDIEMKAQSCEGCATAQKNPAKVAVKPWEVADRPWKRIHVDFAGPINGNMFLIVVDAHSKCPEVLHMSQITTEQTIESLKTVFARTDFDDLSYYSTSEYKANTVRDAFEKTNKKLRNCSDRRFKISKTVMACNYARDRKLWRKGVTGDVVCSTPKDDKRTKCVTKAQGLLTVKRKKIIRKRRKLNEVGSLPDEALSAGNSPNLADKNAQDLESPNIFQDQTSTPHKVSVDSSKATVYAESKATSIKLCPKAAQSTKHLKHGGGVVGHGMEPQVETFIH
ncbi:Transposon Tf2-9 polyprotein [Trichinella pseudospiralis]|uniref:RNA-directed DNA polymerase n=1 Tax=Trichinella pseudospiralis TaxID=6337 RepID=A0A0V1EKG7_TRIPS|nr:Transposon Tf2-9 polyprotein [Trichinella pseudospiralis]